MCLITELPNAHLLRRPRKLQYLECGVALHLRRNADEGYLKRRVPLRQLAGRANSATR